MIEDYIERITNEYQDIVKSIEKLDILKEEDISRIKAKIILFDGTILWIREFWISNKIEKYSYYWLRPDESVIIGWDNAPHHKEITTFPHHKHSGNKVESSNQTKLKEVLEFIREMLGN